MDSIVHSSPTNVCQLPIECLNFELIGITCDMITKSQSTLIFYSYFNYQVISDSSLHYKGRSNSAKSIK